MTIAMSILLFIMLFQYWKYSAKKRGNPRDYFCQIYAPNNNYFFQHNNSQIVSTLWD